MVWVQVAVTKGLHTVALYPVESVQAIVAAKVFAGEEHDVAHPQLPRLDRHNHHMVAVRADERQHTTPRHL